MKRSSNNFEVQRCHRNEVMDRRKKDAENAQVKRNFTKKIRHNETIKRE